MAVTARLACSVHCQADEDSPGADTIVPESPTDPTSRYALMPFVSVPCLGQMTSSPLRRYSLNYLNGSIPPWNLPGPAFLAPKPPPFHAAGIEPSKGANDDVTVQHAYDLTIAELISPRF